MISHEYEVTIKQCTDFIGNANSYLDSIFQNLNNQSMVLKSSDSNMKTKLDQRKIVQMEFIKAWSMYKELKTL